MSFNRRQFLAAGAALGATGAIAVSPEAIDVFWDPAADERTPASEISYRVFVARRSGGQDFSLPDFTSRRGASSQRLEGLEPGTRYFIVVRAEDAAGNQVNYDRSVVEKRLDVLRARLAAEESGQRIGISRLVAGGPNDG